ncbi:hypothetical protein PMZ80_001530 [Knufia obscura]|uniref:Uncharacterized protein n=2 Tax=Knufia TaxID=430999 RepID=A0AAN8FCB5_9EURO|nr:hypothetical protein PMZ80_001530 [Knufia obscura]KAK5955646.1 hypothetical protein OHC33_003287 [Knufia fluminis]
MTNQNAKRTYADVNTAPSSSKLQQAREATDKAYAAVLRSKRVVSLARGPQTAAKAQQALERAQETFVQAEKEYRTILRTEQQKVLARTAPKTSRKACGNEVRGSLRVQVLIRMGYAAKDAGDECVAAAGLEQTPSDSADNEDGESPIEAVQSLQDKFQEH